MALGGQDRGGDERRRRPLSRQQSRGLPPTTSFVKHGRIPAHWTGGKDRLDRGLSSRFGSAAYAQEELRAELASVFLGKVLDLPSDIPNHASYLGSWIETLKADKREIFRAASDAQRIADYLLAFHPDYAVQADISTESEAPHTALAA